MATPTAQEQLMLELINRARLDPAAEAARQGIALNSGLAANSISTAAKQVLAFNFDLDRRGARAFGRHGQPRLLRAQHARQ